MPFEMPSVQGGRQRNFFLILCMAPMENSHDCCGCHDPLSQSYCPPQILDPPASPGPPSPDPFLPQKPRGGIPGSEGGGRRGPGEGALEGWGWGSWDQRPRLRQGCSSAVFPAATARQSRADGQDAFMSCVEDPPKTKGIFKAKLVFRIAVGPWSALERGQWPALPAPPCTGVL